MMRNNDTVYYLEMNFLNYGINRITDESGVFSRLDVLRGIED